MTTTSHPWTFVHPACGQPAVHAALIPKLAQHVDIAGVSGGLEHLDGRPVRPLDLRECDTCGQILDALDVASMTIEANWRRRDGAAA